MSLLRRPTLLDGAMGTALLARGLPPDAVPEEWVLERPDEVARVHAEHAAAGARLLLTATFGCPAAAIARRLGAERIASLCAAAVHLARTAAEDGVLVAGAVGPTGLSIPRGPPAPPAALATRFAPPLAALAEAGADLLWIESQWDLAEARAALAAGRATGLPCVVTFTFAEDGGRFRAPDGTPAEACLAGIASAGAAAAGVNCVFAGPALDTLSAWATAHLGVPFVAKPSPGLPGAVLAPEAFARALRPALDAGLSVVGGCCGATGDHLRAIGPLLAAR
jgi:5-methyltetrahydrofolate--homocysteine methyltransferase